MMIMANLIAINVLIKILEGLLTSKPNIPWEIWRLIGTPLQNLPVIDYYIYTRLINDLRDGQLLNPNRSFKLVLMYGENYQELFL